MLSVQALAAMGLGAIAGVTGVVIDNVKVAGLGLAAVSFGALEWLFRKRGVHPGRIGFDPDLDKRVPIADVLARHRLNVAWLRERGHVPPKTYDMDSFLFAQQRFYAHPAVHYEFEESMRVLLGAKLVPMAIVVPLAYVQGFAHPAPWAALLAVNLWQLARRRL
jgi:hypothetical protein